MNLKKVAPVILLIVMAVMAISINRCNNNRQTASTKKETQRTYPNPVNTTEKDAKLDRSSTNLFFTKHAKCRMKCRHISQEEVKDILANGTVNYTKSNLNDPRGATYALEGTTKDRQHVRIIFAPKQQHLTVVTVIDLEEEFICNCN